MSYPLRSSIFLVVLGVATALSLHAQPIPDDGEHQMAPPLRLGVVGMVHGHVHGFLGARPYDDVQLVGFAESDTAVAAEVADQYDLDEDRVYLSLSSMLEAERLDAVVGFTNTFDHRRVVEEAAPRGVHVMVEKPLAVNMEHARAMRDAAEANDIHVLVNYETTWYPSMDRAYAFVRSEERLGPLRKVVVRDGHRGPKEIGVGTTFLNWLTDPTLNGDGALMDFGCYGVNLMTWLMEGRRPQTVSAITQQFKSDPDYARVDDEATIVLTYSDAQAIIQASWNWPYSRKDLSIYGEQGYVHADNATEMRVRTGDTNEESMSLESQPTFYEAAIPHFKNVVRGHTEPNVLSALDTNMLVTEILDAARRSAKTGETVRLQ